MRMHRFLIGLALLAACGGAVAGATETASVEIDAGRRVFAQCQSCHRIGANARSGFGPQLNGIVGRRAGSLGDFAYSPAMRKAGFVWDEARLRAFLRAPDTVVPGNKMRFWGLGDARELDALIAYLQSAGAAR